MKGQLTYFFASVFIILNSLSFSQNQSSKWYFGNNAGLDFMSSPPTVLTNGALSSVEAASSIADGAGNLLFYTDGITVWNQLHAVMANGTGLLGDNSTTQGALIVKQPGNATIYFVFTLDEVGFANGLRYSVVDMSLAAGMGSVTTKNTLIQTPSTEKLCGVKHCNGTDTWVISHDHHSNVFRAELVTAAGVGGTEVLSPVGQTIDVLDKTVGYMKISPNGKKLGLAIYSPPSFELYDFNTATGVVSNPIQLPVPSPAGKYAYGCEFSPDGTKFYGTNGVVSLHFHPSIDLPLQYQLNQWDLCAGSASAIAASQQTMTAPEAFAMQLAPDGKIYVARATESGVEFMLGVINDPNASFSGINYVSTGQSVFPNSSAYGLPNFVTGFYKTPVAQFTYTFNPAISCVTASFTAPPLINATCSATSYTIDHIAWLFGDAASGAANTSALSAPMHTYPGSGVYNAKLILFNSCGGVIDTLKQQVMIAQVPLNTSSSGFSLCAGQSATLNASGLTTYAWSTGATTSSISITPTITTTYTVQGPGLNGCPLKSVQVVTVNPVPVITISGSHTVCVGSAFTQTASGANSYTWSNGTNGPVLQQTSSGTNAYTVTGNSYGCISTAVTSATFLPVPLLTVTGASYVCLGSGVLQTASGASSYSWSNGATTSTTTLIAIGTTAFGVTGTSANGCIAKATVTIESYYLPLLSIAGSHTICESSVLTLTASGASTYSWNNGTTTAITSVSPVATTGYTVTGTDARGCTNAAHVTINLEQAPALTVSSGSACSGDVISLSVTSATAQGLSYAWLPSGVGGSGIQTSAEATQIYTVIATSVAGCTASAQSTLSIQASPQLDLSPAVHILPGASTTLHVSGANTFTWSPADDLSCVDCESPVASPSKNMHYCVMAGRAPCLSSACVDVVVACETNNDFSMPNAFTPNGDHNNDEFCLQGWNECTTGFSILIFDRWGEKVFESADPAFCWDGIFRGQLLSAGIYIYAISAKKINSDASIHKKGNITLIR